MALNDAIKLLNTMKDKKSLRESMYLLDSPGDLDNFIKSLGYNFNFDEIDDAYRVLLLKCSDKNEAEEISEIYSIYRMLIGMAPVFAPSAN